MAESMVIENILGSRLSGVLMGRRKFFQKATADWLSAGI
jgi:hypothetical protein